MRKAFNFYLSFYELMKLLNEVQIADIIMAICKVQFLEIHIDDIEFQDKMTQIVWVGVKHSIKASVDGYCSKMNIDYDTTLGKGHPEVVSHKEKNKEEVKEEVKEKNNSLNLIVMTDAQRVATYLLQKILDNKPNFKIPEVGTWEKDIEKAIRLDGRTVEQLLGCIDWIYTDEGNFWIPNILSAKKLREKFDVMESQIMTSPKNKRRHKTAQILKKRGY